MTGYVLGIAIVIVLSIIAEKFSDKCGLPALILFMFIGMIFGSDGIFKIGFDDYSFAETACSLALVFIMFYGGFNTKWSVARPVAGKAITLSTVGVVATAGITALLCRLVLRMSFSESFLIGAVLSSTDAASVFDVLRKKKLNLKDGTASLLEVESGSNDPVAFMLTVIAISFFGVSGSKNIALMIVLQIIVGILAGLAVSFVTVIITTKTNIVSDGLDTIFMIAMVLICYGLSSLLGGNAYLSLYIYGIIAGNSRINNKQRLIHFFDGVTNLSQILVFFLIGLLSFPSQMLQIIPTALFIVTVLTFVARPLTVYILMIPFKSSIRQCALIAWAGLRGASSCVFAIMAVASGISVKQDLFHVVFMVTLISVSFQGGMLPFISKKLCMVDDAEDVRKTFNDYQEENALSLMRMYIPKGHNWADRKVKEVNMPHGSLAIMIKRGDESIITKGDTVIRPDDTVILSVPPYFHTEDEKLEEITIMREHKWCGRMVGELGLTEDELIALIIREDKNIIPDGKTVINEGDKVVLYK